MHGFVLKLSSSVATLAGMVSLVFVAGCASQSTSTTQNAPPLDEFCLEAQRVVVRTDVVPALVVHQDFNSFVKSKASIDPLTIQQYVWYEDDDPTKPLMISCKLKSADHLNEAYGAGTSAGNGRCQDMNRLTWEWVRASLGSRHVEDVVFDEPEEVWNDKNPGMTGPDWLKPYTMAWRDKAGVLHIRSKGFRVDWKDPRFSAMPARFRGVQYCHLITPQYLTRLVTGKAQAGLKIGRDVSNYAPPTDAR
ncbi:MAG: hypothetical protein R3F24_14930 [Gammaproteobacteria bacterium]